jgi:hypothetical protein
MIVVPLMPAPMNRFSSAARSWAVMLKSGSLAIFFLPSVVVLLSRFTALVQSVEGLMLLGVLIGLPFKTRYQIAA